MNTPEAHPKPLLDATNQRRKLGWAGYIAIPGSVALMAAFGSALPADYRFLLGFGGFTLFVVGAIFAFYSIRCPKCRLSWVKWAVGNQPHNQWLHWLYQFSECPKCKYRA